MIVCNYREDPRVEAEKVAFLVNKQVDGLIIVPSGESAAEINGLLQRGIPVVLVDRLLPNVSCDAVVVNNSKIAGEAVDVFVQKGHRRIAIICGPKGVITAQERLEGYLSVHKRYGLPVDERFIKFGDYYMDSGYRLCRELLNLAPAPTALFVTNYDMTLGVIRAINEEGLTVPNDISIIGFDDLPVFQAVKPHYSVIAQPMRALGETCARRILERLKGEWTSPQVVTLEAKLLLKESVSVPP
ncbi:substrate-binding domain-containing protein [Terrilactibacillus sp. S3-3]|nr:substrate-binding domain-containing protein [Terrilactibacillus sp. S3-3]